MRESRTYGSVRGALSNERPYRERCVSALNEFRGKLTEADNLLIYYAGHGTLEEKNQRGYWLPVDAGGE